MNVECVSGLLLMVGVSSEVRKAKKLLRGLGSELLLHEAEGLLDVDNL